MHRTNASTTTQRWRDQIWARPAVLAALATQVEQRRKSNAMNDKTWEIMYGKTQSGQGKQAYPEQASWQLMARLQEVPGSRLSNR